MADVTYTSGSLTYKSHEGSSGVEKVEVLANSTEKGQEVTSKITLTIDGTQSSATVQATKVLEKNKTADVATSAEGKWKITVKTDDSLNLTAEAVDTGGEGNWSHSLSGHLVSGGTFPIEGLSAEGGGY